MGHTCLPLPLASVAQGMGEGVGAVTIVRYGTAPSAVALFQSHLPVGHRVSREKVSAGGSKSKIQNCKKFSNFKLLKNESEIIAPRKT